GSPTEESTLSYCVRSAIWIPHRRSSSCARRESGEHGSRRGSRSWSPSSGASFLPSSRGTCSSRSWAWAARCRHIEILIYRASSRPSQQWFDGQSGGDTPGPIPNPEVKPAHVPCGSAVREPARSLPSFEEGLGRRPRYASRPSLWWTTKRAVLTAVGPWNAVSHSVPRSIDAYYAAAVPASMTDPAFAVRAVSAGVSSVRRTDGHRERLMAAFSLRSTIRPHSHRSTGANPPSIVIS